MSSLPSVAYPCGVVVVTGVDRLLSLPYQLVRRPLAVLDEHAIKKLPSGNPVRELYHAGLRLADGIARIDRPRSGESEQSADDPADEFGAGDSGAADDAPDESAEPTAHDEPTDAEREQAEEQRRHDFAKKEEQITRGNRSPATMARELAQLRAAEEAREHEAAENKVGDSTD